MHSPHFLSTSKSVVVAHQYSWWSFNVHSEYIVLWYLKGNTHLAPIALPPVVSPEKSTTIYSILLNINIITIYIKNILKSASHNVVFPSKTFNISCPTCEKGLSFLHLLQKS